MIKPATKSERAHVALQIAREALADQRIDCEIFEHGAGYRVKLTLRPLDRMTYIRTVEDWWALKACWEDL
jgi:hypothetical protein